MHQFDFGFYIFKHFQYIKVSNCWFPNRIYILWPRLVCAWFVHGKFPSKLRNKNYTSTNIVWKSLSTSYFGTLSYWGIIRFAVYRTYFEDALKVILYQSPKLISLELYHQGGLNYLKIISSIPWQTLVFSAHNSASSTARYISRLCGQFPDASISWRDSPR